MPLLLRAEQTALASAVYTLALRIVGDEAGAADAVTAAAERARRPGELVHAVREEARNRRGEAVGGGGVPVPSPAAEIPPADWEVLERVALRGMRLDEAA